MGVCERECVSLRVLFVCLGVCVYGRAGGRACVCEFARACAVECARVYVRLRVRVCVHMRAFMCVRLRVCVCMRLCARGFTAPGVE